MKSSKSFKVGDKVFAKVKGYPAWPAVIIENKINRYNVRFYGTGETGMVKPKDLFYYLKHKNSFVKTLKRKDYNDAIGEIERAIEEAGTDGNDDETKMDLTTSSNDKSNNTAKAAKRKRSASRSEKVSDVQAKRRARSRSKTPHPTGQTTNNAEEHVKLEENDSTKLANYSDENIHPIEKEENQSLTINEEQDAINQKSEPGIIKSEIEENNGISYGITDVHVISVEFLQGLIQYAEYTRREEEIFKNLPAEERVKDEIELLIVKQLNGKLVGIKFNYENPPPSLDNEYKYAQYEEIKAEKLLACKTSLEQGSCHSEDDPEMFVTNLKFNMADVIYNIEMNLIARKKRKLVWLNIERNLVKLDGKIKSNLGLERAHPKEALEHLNKMYDLKLEPLMLLKHSAVVDVVKRLCRYIGNTEQWNLTDDEREVFEMEAAKIRDKAASVYLKFSNIFDVEDASTFWGVFSKAVGVFKQQVKDMTDNYVYALSAEPYSRQAFFDTIDEAEEMKLVETTEQY